MILFIPEDKILDETYKFFKDIGGIDLDQLVRQRVEVGVKITPTSTLFIYSNVTYKSL